MQSYNIVRSSVAGLVGGAITYKTWSHKARLVIATPIISKYLETIPLYIFTGLAVGISSLIAGFITDKRGVIVDESETRKDPMVIAQMIGITAIGTVIAHGIGNKESLSRGIKNIITVAVASEIVGYGVATVIQNKQNEQNDGTYAYE